MEQRCLLLDRHIAFQRFKILDLKSEIQTLDSKYQSDSHQLRAMKRGIEELEGMVKEKEMFYELNAHEMKAFREDVDKFVYESEIQVRELRNQANELKSIFIQLQGNNGYLSNSEIDAAEMRKAQLVAMKEDLERKLESNYQIRSGLQNKLKEVINYPTSESDYNRQLGVFQVRVEMVAASGKVTGNSSKACIVEFRSQAIRILKTAIKSGPLVAGFTSEYQILKINMKMMKEQQQLQETSYVKVMIESRANTGTGIGIPEIYEASLSLHSHIPLFKTLLWNWRRTLFIWFSFFMFFTQFIFFIVLFFRGIPPKTTCSTSSSLIH